MQTSSSYPQLSHTDRFTASEMAKAMRDGHTTRDELVPLFGKKTVEKLGEHAADLARKSESSLH
jgi:hypothetical protein